MLVPRFDTIHALHDAAALEAILGPITAIEAEPLGTIGYSGAVHHRLKVQLRSGGRLNLVVKHVHLDRDWTAYRTGDVHGREAMLLAEPQLQGIWEIFQCPYCAYAVQNHDIGLLMSDLSAHLLPDVDAPLSQEQEDALLAGLAALHAKYWDVHVLDLSWLATPGQLLAVLGPGAGEEEGVRTTMPALFGMVVRGWTAAFAAAPRAVTELLCRPPEALAGDFDGLPHTIIHGDAKVANFALVEEGSVALFDWAWVGAAPCTVDLGWYLAVNASRLARPREAVMRRYRAFLEAGLGRRLSDQIWRRLIGAGILSAARMLLWSKALARDTGAPDALNEWNWWIEQLQDLDRPGS